MIRCFQLYEQVCQEIADFDSSNADEGDKEIFSFDDIMSELKTLNDNHGLKLLMM